MDKTGLNTKFFPLTVVVSLFLARSLQSIFKENYEELATNVGLGAIAAVIFYQLCASGYRKVAWGLLMLPLVVLILLLAGIAWDKRGH